MNIVQMENRMKGVPDEALRQMYVNMARDPYKVGTPDFIMLAGEIQARKDIRQKEAMGQGSKTSVIADLLTEGAMPPMPQQQMPQQMAQAPAEGGVAALPAPSASQEFATGGMVAFSNGGSSATDITPFIYQNRAAFDNVDVAGGALSYASPVTPVPLRDVLSKMSLQERMDYQRSGVLPEKYRKLLQEGAPRPDYSKSLEMSRFSTEPSADTGGVATESLAQAQQRMGVVPPPKDAPPAAQQPSLTGGLDSLARTNQLLPNEFNLYEELSKKGAEATFMQDRADERKKFGDPFKEQEKAIQKSLDRIPGLEKQYNAAILFKAAGAIGSTPGGLLKGLNAAGGAIANDVMNKAEKLTSIQDRIDERQAQLASDKIKLARTDNEKDRNEFARRIEKREGGLQSLTLARAQIQGGIENTLLNVASRERLGELQLTAASLEREVGREEARKKSALEVAQKQVLSEAAKNPSLMTDPVKADARIMELYSSYLNVLNSNDGKGATTPPSMKEQARKILEEKGIKS
jgi:hypothetical protein